MKIENTKVINYFSKKAPSKMFHRVLNTHLKEYMEHVARLNLDLTLLL